MLNLTTNQIESLNILNEEKSIPMNSSKVNKNTMNSLYFKGLIRCPKYANGFFWEMTDKGLDYLESIKPPQPIYPTSEEDKKRLSEFNELNKKLIEKYNGKII
jgi:hypothetical protein